MPGMGYWRVHSNTDPRWDADGRAFGDGLFGCDEMDEWIKKCKQEYGQPPPDATKEFWKD